MIKYLKYYLLIFKISVMDQMAHRENFFIWTLVHAFSLITNIIFFKILYSQVSQINGWTQDQVLLVLGVGNLITGLGSLTFFPFMYSFERDISKGDFDFKLSKPIDPHFQSAFSSIDIEDFAVVPISLLLIAYSLSRLRPDFLLVNSLGFILLLTNSLVFLFSLITLIESIAFKSVRIRGGVGLVWSIVNTGKYPAKSIKSLSLVVSSLLFPTALMSSVPAEVLFGKWDLPWIIASFLCAFSLLFISRQVFTSGIKQYSSASS